MSTQDYCETMPEGATAASRTRVVIADDTKFFRKHVRTLMEKQGYEIVGEAKDGNEAVDMTAAHRPDLVVMDIDMPNVNGIEASSIISRTYPGTTIVAFTQVARPSTVLECLKAGCSNFVLKSSPDHTLLRAIEHAL